MDKIVNAYFFFVEYRKVHFRKITLYMKDGNVTSLPDTVSIDSPVNCATYHTPNDTGNYQYSY